MVIDINANANLDTEEMGYIVQVIKRKMNARDALEEVVMIMRRVNPGNAGAMISTLEMDFTVLVEDGMITVTDNLVVDALLMLCVTEEVMANGSAYVKLDLLAMDSDAEDRVSIGMDVVALRMHDVSEMLVVGNVNVRASFLEMGSTVQEDNQNHNAIEEMAVLATKTLHAGKILTEITDVPVMKDSLATDSTVPVDQKALVVMNSSAVAVTAMPTVLLETINNLDAGAKEVSLETDSTVKILKWMSSL